MRTFLCRSGATLYVDNAARVVCGRQAGYCEPCGQVVGLITINLKEADSVERERARTDLGETQRTLVGHFRHELGHYVYDRLIRDDTDRRQRFVETFDDPQTPTYADAMKRHRVLTPMVVGQISLAVHTKLRVLAELIAV